SSVSNPPQKRRPRPGARPSAIRRDEASPRLPRPSGAGGLQGEQLEHRLDPPALERSPLAPGAPALADDPLDPLELGLAGELARMWRDSPKRTLRDLAHRP